MSESNNEELLTLFQIGSELGVSAAKANKYFKTFQGFIPFQKSGRSNLFTLEALRRLKFIHKLASQKKSSEQILDKLCKKYPDCEAAMEAMQSASEEKSEPARKNSKGSGKAKAVSKGAKSKKSSKKGKKPLLERVDDLEALADQLREINRNLAKLDKISEEFKELKSLRKEFAQLDSLKAEVARLKKLIEG